VARGIVRGTGCVGRRPFAGRAACACRTGIVAASLVQERAASRVGVGAAAVGGRACPRTAARARVARAPRTAGSALSTLVGRARDVGPADVADAATAFRVARAVNAVGRALRPHADTGAQSPLARPGAAVRCTERGAGLPSRLAGALARPSSPSDRVALAALATAKLPPLLSSGSSGGAFPAGRDTGVRRDPVLRGEDVLVQSERRQHRGRERSLDQGPPGT
jgi:hypothetical protein